MNELNIAELRRRYSKEGLLESDLPENPVDLLKIWLEQAVNSAVTEPNAMSLATVDKKGRPDARIVLLKGITEQGVLFFTNYGSLKARQLSDTPFASCCFWWPELERQIRLGGTVRKIPQEESREYFATRPRESQIGAWASDQSRPVTDREELDRLYREYDEKFQDIEIPMPDDWGGFEILIDRIEFWQGRTGRLHDRILFRKLAESWSMVRLAP